MIPLKQSTASQEIPLGYFLDSTDGDTEETGLTIANTDIKLWKNGASTLANKNSGGATHIANGVYYCTLDATDTNTLGALVIFVHVSGALAIKVNCVVLPANVYDSLIAASDYLQADTTQIEGSDATDQINAQVVDVMRTDTIPDSYASDGSQPTIAQALLGILQFLTEKEVSGTTVTVKKPNGSTTAMTFTLDDGTTPTSITRTT